MIAESQRDATNFRRDESIFDANSVVLKTKLQLVIPVTRNLAGDIPPKPADLRPVADLSYIIINNRSVKMNTTTKPDGPITITA